MNAEKMPASRKVAIVLPLLAALAMVAINFPELRRYFRIRRM